MTTYYVDFVNGLDANNGLGPDASHASNKPWKTLTKALGATGIASGDTVYIAPVTFRETCQVGMTSPVTETQVIGDFANAQGFKTSGGVLLTAGDVILSAYTTNDTTTPSTSTTLDLNGRDFLTFRNILFVAGNSSNTGCVLATTTNSTNIKFVNCAFIGSRSGGQNIISYTGLADIASNWLIDSCYFAPSIALGGSAVIVTLPTSASADYDSNFQFKNCVINAPGASQVINISATGAASFKGGGVDIFNCTFIGGGSQGCVRTSSANISTSIPCTVYNSLIIGANGLNSNTSGQILEDNNRICANPVRTNVTAGAASIADATHAILFHFGYEQIIGAMSRPFGMPMANSPLLGRGATAGGPVVDILNRPRPAGGNSISYAWGTYERHDTAAKETSVVDAGSNAVKITGPGDHDLVIPVNAALTTITVRTRYDTNHATTNKPQATILNGEEIGITSETKTAVVGVDTWETLTFTSFTPSVQGFITLRLISRAAAGNGVAYFDTVTGGANGSQGLDYFRRAEPFPAAVATASASGAHADVFGKVLVR